MHSRLVAARALSQSGVCRPRAVQLSRRQLSSGAREHGGPLPLLSGLVRRGDWLPDGAQQDVVEVLQQVYAGVARAAVAGGDVDGVGGAYLHGPVGSGKTALMDLLASSCDAGQVRRLHFHELMGHVHGELHRGASVPAIGAALGSATPLLCVDEIQLTDIADAAIVSRLVSPRPNPSPNPSPSPSPSPSP